MKRKVDWFRVVVILALGAAVIWVSIILGRSSIGWMIPSANAQTVPPAEVRFPKPITLQNRETYSMAIDQTHQVCWSDPNSPQASKIKIWRYRVEGGARTLYLDLPRSGWVADTVPNSFCKQGISVPKAGHWIYDAALCWTNSGVDTCSDVVTASCAAGVTGCSGAVGSSSRGWWIYVFLPAPSGPVVN